MAEYTTRPLGLIVLPIGEPTFSEMATKITVEGEGAGEFLVISQDARESGSISITSEEWPSIVKAVNILLEQIREAKKEVRS